MSVKDKEGLAAGAELLRRESSGSIASPAPAATRWQDNPLGGHISRSSSTGAGATAAAVASVQRLTAV